MRNCSMAFNFAELNAILDVPQNTIVDFFRKFDDVRKESTELRKKYNLDGSGFNIFTSIAEKYRHEELHSDIISRILDPESDKIGNPKNIRLFVDLLKKIKPNVSVSFSGKVVVKREEENIDILIYDESDGGDAIIIENKINWARDQYNQIGKYYEKVKKEMGKNVKAIVYLTLTPEKQIDKKKSIVTHAKEINKLLIPVSVFRKDSDTSFADGFIKECIKHIGNSEQNELARIYYAQYYEFLFILGGSDMENDLYRRTMKEIFENRQLDTFRYIGKLWDERHKAITGLIMEQLQLKGFERYPGEEDGCVYKKINDDVSLAYNLENSFGFRCTPGSKPTSFKKHNKNLIDCLKSAELKGIFSDEEAHNDTWVWKVIDVDKITDLDVIIKDFEILESEWKGLKRSV